MIGSLLGSDRFLNYFLLLGIFILPLVLTLVFFSLVIVSMSDAKSTTQPWSFKKLTVLFPDPRLSESYFEYWIPQDDIDTEELKDALRKIPGIEEVLFYDDHASLITSWKANPPELVFNQVWYFFIHMAPNYSQKQYRWYFYIFVISSTGRRWLHEQWGARVSHHRLYGHVGCALHWPRSHFDRAYQRQGGSARRGAQRRCAGSLWEVSRGIGDLLLYSILIALFSCCAILTLYTRFTPQPLFNLCYCTQTPFTKTLVSSYLPLYIVEDCAENIIKKFPSILYTILLMLLHNIDIIYVYRLVWIWSMRCRTRCLSPSSVSLRTPRAAPVCSMRWGFYTHTYLINV